MSPPQNNTPFGSISISFVDATGALMNRDVSPSETLSILKSFPKLSIIPELFTFTRDATSVESKSDSCNCAPLICMTGFNPPEFALLMLKMAFAVLSVVVSNSIPLL